MPSRSGKTEGPAIKLLVPTLRVGTPHGVLIMSQSIDQLFSLVDSQQRELGQFQLERREGTLLAGRFRPGPGFPAVAKLFRDFEEAANSQALALIDQHDRAIAALGLALRAPEGSDSVEIQDVQIWSDGAISCRLLQPAQLPENGNLATAQTRRAVRR